MSGIFSRVKQTFPKDFMFQLTTIEAETLRSQFATSNAGDFIRPKTTHLWNGFAAGVGFAAAAMPRRKVSFNPELVANYTDQKNGFEFREGK